MYFGSDETLAGPDHRREDHRGGRRQDPVHHPGPGLGRAGGPLRGRQEGFPNTENLQVNGAGPAVGAVRPSRRSCSRTQSITHIVTLGAPIALAALQAQGDADSQAKIITFDLNKDAAQAIKDGKIEFSVDQQPYVQGYMAVDVAVAEPDQRQRHRRRPAGADRPVHRGQDQHRPDPALHAEQHPLTAPPGGAAAAGSRRRSAPRPSLGSHHMSTPVDDANRRTPTEPRQAAAVVGLADPDPPGVRRDRRRDRDLHLLLRRRPAVPHAARVRHRAVRLAPPSGSSPSGWRC